MTDKIKKALLEITEREKFNLLFACESGSRGWGFASPDSDFDIRFIYVFPKKEYLNIDGVVENYTLPLTPDGLDLGGWELRKTLRLARGGNMTLFEWLQSPIIYSTMPNFQIDLFETARPYFSPRAALHHYLGIAKNALETATKDGSIKIKKYFYVLRPLLAAIWIIERNDVPPMNFHELRILIKNKSINGIIDSLLIQKNEAQESETIVLIPELQDFIKKEWERCESHAKLLIKQTPLSVEPLNNFFTKWLPQ